MSKFKPGQSGNPGGRPKGFAEVRELAREHTVAAIEKLVAIMTTGQSEQAQRRDAAGSLLSRLPRTWATGCAPSPSRRRRGAPTRGAAFDHLVGVPSDHVVPVSLLQRRALPSAELSNVRPHQASISRNAPLPNARMFGFRSRSARGPHAG